jgi:hypothetical protein
MIKRSIILYVFALLFVMSGSDPLGAQTEGPARFNAGADIYSSYVWRGTKYGKGPAIQPKLEFKAGPFTAGAWGSFDFSDYQETDLYVSFALPAGFSLGITDYYYPTLDYFDYSDTTGSHAFEINTGFSKGPLILSGNYILNQAGSAGSEGRDKYIEIKYSFDSFSLFLGAGDGWHSVNSSDGSDRFTVCNVGLGTSRDIKVTDSFSIPVTGQLVFNPDLKRMYILAGFSF